MKNIFKILSLCMLGILFININVYASSNTTYVNLETKELSLDGKSYSSITSYDNLEDFLVDYKSGSLPVVYITNFLFDGVSTVKSPDLDDFIENDSNDTKIKTLEIEVFNINTTGDIELTGTTVGSMIAINTNDVKEDINLLLNNVNIDTDSKKAPAIFVYNKSTLYTDCKVTIKTLKGTKNYIEGGKLKKVSLIGSDNLDDYASYYSSDALTNYNKYSSYYGIYTSDEIEDILFATVKADSEDLQDGDPVYFYKGSGAISSDIDLYFEGEGYLKVTSKNKEGIETKGNLTLTGGVGDYEVYAYDDCLNTTTATNTSSSSSVRNDMYINVNSLVAIVDDEGDEGDAIDSNGTLTIDGGTIYAFSNSNSQDAGIDSSNGTYINGGTILSTGNMADEIETGNNLKSIYVNFNNTISKDSLVVIKDSNDNIILAFKAIKNFSNLYYSSDDLNIDSYSIYENGEIDGTCDEFGIYTNIISYENGDKLSYSEVSNNMKLNNFNISKSNNFILYMLLIEIALLIIVLVINFIFLK